MEAVLNTMDPRVAALTEGLARLNHGELNLRWAAVMDYDGLILASYPPNDQGAIEEAVGATAHILHLGERAQSQVNFGKWRYSLIAGAELQVLVLHLNNEVVLSMGVGSRAQLHRIFSAVREVVPVLIRSLDLSARKFAEPNTMLIHREQLDRYLEGS